MRVLIDSGSGCCNGVGRAISTAEKYLSSHERLFSLGAIVHNDAEIQRLAGLGLRTVGYSDLPSCAVPPFSSGRTESRLRPIPWPAMPGYRS